MDTSNPNAKKIARGSRGSKKRKTVEENTKAPSKAPESRTKTSKKAVQYSSDTTSSSSASADSEEGVGKASQKTRTAISNASSSKRVKLATETSRSSSSSLTSSPSESLSASETDESASEDVRQDEEKPQGESETEPAPEPKQPDFDAWYLRLVTDEFASDLDKLRKAPDFKESSVPILIRALKQGAELFSEEEKKIVMGQLAAQAEPHANGVT